jgi:fumarylacetoacetate (FAA) hydrolase
MRLATWNDGTRDGRLVVVSQDGARAWPADGVASTLQAALDRWDEVAPRLRSLADALERGSRADELRVDPDRLCAPLPRAYEWIDGSAYINHIVLVRKARGAEPPATLRTEPLVYQGGSGAFLGPTAPVAHFDEAFGIDFESEVCVVTGDVPMGTTAADARRHADRYVRLVMICNDVTLRNLVPAELEKGFGFFVSKPATAFAPFAVTPDELGDAWRDGRVHLPLRTTWNGELFGDPEAGEAMHFGFFELLEHVTKTRRLTAGTLLGSGTVSNEDPARGSSCIAEQRMREKIATGAISTPFMKFGDTVRIEMCDAGGRSIFGRIDQTVVRATRPE